MKSIGCVFVSILMFILSNISHTNNCTYCSKLSKLFFGFVNWENGVFWSVYLHRGTIFFKSLFLSGLFLCFRVSALFRLSSLAYVILCGRSHLTFQSASLFILSKIKPRNSWAIPDPFRALCACTFVFSVSTIFPWTEFHFSCYSPHHVPKPCDLEIGICLHTHGRMLSHSVVDSVKFVN